MSSWALAIFVKTPGLSPVKTRLASSIGQDRALSLYEKCCRSVEAVAEELERSSANGAWEAYWAVAEVEGLSDQRWAGLKSISQGDGGLGDRLSLVYSSLLARHEGVCVIGADLPQISPSLLLRARELCSSGAFAIGNAADGGFYLFAGRAAVPRELWMEIPYSSERTGNALKLALRRLGASIVDLEATLSDLDEGRDLEVLARELSDLRSRGEALPAQLDLLAEIEKEKAGRR